MDSISSRPDSRNLGKMTSRFRYGPRDRTKLLRRMIKFDERLVDIAPAPSLWWVVTFNDRMTARLKMFGGVFARGLVATTDVPT